MAWLNRLYTQTISIHCHHLYQYYASLQCTCYMRIVLEQLIHSQTGDSPPQQAVMVNFTVPTLNRTH